MKYTITVMNPADYYTVRRAFCHYFYNDRALLCIVDIEEWKTLQIVFINSEHARRIEDTVKKILDNAKCEVYVIKE